MAVRRVMPQGFRGGGPGGGRQRFVSISSDPKPLAGDISTATIQLLFLAGGNPRIYGKALLGAARTMVDPQFLATYMARAENRAIVQKYPNLLLSRGGTTEFTEAMGRGGLLRRGPLRVAGKALEPFQRGWEGSIDIAGIEMAKSLDHLATDAGRIQDLGQFINEFRGLTSSSRLGVSTLHRQVETATVLAPRYNRAIASLMFDVTRGGLRGRLARNHMARGVTALMLMSMAISYSRGEDLDDILAHMNPNSRKFMTWEVGGQNIGPGSKVRSVVKLWGAVIDDPQSLGDTSVGWGKAEFITNPLIRFIRGVSSPAVSTSWDLITGKDFIGDPTRDGLLSFSKTIARRFIPIWMQTAALEGGSVADRAIRGAAEFGGLRSFPVNIIANLSQEFEGEIEPYFDIETTADKREVKGQRQSRIQFRKTNPEIEAKLFILGQVSTLRSKSRGRRAARDLIIEHDILSFDIDPEQIEIWEKELGPLTDIVPSADEPPEDLEQLAPFLGGSVLPESDEPGPITVSNENVPATWDEVSQRFSSGDLQALDRVWNESGELSSGEETRLRAVFEDFPLGQTNFNVWLKRTLRQAQANAAVQVARV